MSTIADWLIDSEPAWRDALLAAALLAVDPLGLGGVVVRARAGPVRDVWLSAYRSLVSDVTPILRMPVHIGDDRLLGGLDLAATLKSGRSVLQRGLLAEANDGILMAAMAERMPSHTVAQLTGALDRGTVDVERDSLSARLPARFGVVAFDEGQGVDEKLNPSLADRLACSVDLQAVPIAVAHAVHGYSRADIEAAITLLDRVEASDGAVTALAATASAFGIGSIRPSLQAVKVARASAALRGETSVAEPDLVVAARLVLAPRATRIPAPTDAETELHEPPPEPETAPDEQDPVDANASGDQKLEDILLDAVTAALPSELLARLAKAAQPNRRSKTSGSSGPARRSKLRGRPIGAGPGQLGDGARLSIVDTLRVAAPWQRLRGSPSVIPGQQLPAGRRVKVAAEDFRFQRYAQRSESINIFVVDASGSTALHRLGEAKGAVELLLADSYVRRDCVALIALRGREAELVLPPTRALTRAKRSLAGLPGGGGTPLASGIEKAIGLALAARRRDQHPTIVILTDGAANVARDGGTGRRAGEEDAIAAGQIVTYFGLSVMLIDTGPRPSPFASRLAEVMDGRYFALPMADAKAVSNIIKSVSADA